MRLLPCGPDAVLVEVADLAEVEAVRAALRADLAAGRLPGVVDVVPAARTVLVTGGAVDDVSDRLHAIDLRASDAPADRPPDDDTAVVVDLDVHYDGDDLDLVADTAGMSRDEVVEVHTTAEHRVAFGGFAPGFAYLTGLPDPLCQPRLETPRTRVPAGSVGVAGEFSGVYPRSSPGGWRLLGRLTDDAPTLFDPDRDPPALLVPGTRVRFRAS